MGLSWDHLQDRDRVVEGLVVVVEVGWMMMDDCYLLG